MVDDMIVVVSVFDDDYQNNDEVRPSIGGGETVYPITLRWRSGMREGGAHEDK